MNHQKLNSSFTRFIIVGVINNAIDFGLLNLLHLAFQLNLYWAINISFSASTINSYFLNRHWTYQYKSNQKDHLKKISQFFFVSIVGLLMNNGIIYFVTNQTNLNYNYGKIIATVLVVLWNYSINKSWTFKSPRQSI
ncbi:MAG: GtrA family protein [bacterium]|nr:GtrA family protein [bacterium]